MSIVHEKLPESPALPLGGVVQLSPQDYADGSKRAIRVDDLVDTGRFGRGEAENIVKIEARRARGEKVSPALQAAVDNFQSFLVAEIEAEEKMEAALAVERDHAALKDAVAAAKSELDRFEHLLAITKNTLEEDGAEQFLAVAHAGFCGAQDHFKSLAEWGSAHAGLARGAAHLETKVLPHLREMLTRAEKQLADFEKKQRISQ